MIRIDLRVDSIACLRELLATRLAHRADAPPFVLRCIIVYAIKIIRMHVVAGTQEGLAGCRADRTAPPGRCRSKKRIALVFGAGQSLQTYGPCNTLEALRR